MLHDKPPGPMHEALRRAMDELKGHNNPYGCIQYVTTVLSNSEKLSLPSGTDYANAPNGGEANGNNNNAGGGGGNSRGAGYQGVSNPSGFLSGGSWMGAGVGAIEFQGATGIVRPPLSPDPPARAGAKAGAYQHSGGGGGVNASGSAAAGGQGSSDPSSASPANADGTGPSSSEPVTRYTFNATEVVRLLLIRAEAFGVTKQHEKALIDAKSALEVSRGQSPEAHFCLGREHRRLFHITESVDAFDMGEALLRSIQQSLSTDTREAFDAGVKEVTTDEDFWAQRGYTLTEAANLGISRAEFELQEHAAMQRQGAATSRLPTGSLVVPGAARPASSAEERTGAAEDAGAASSDNTLWVNSPVTTSGGLSSNVLDDLLFLRTGISSTELAMWRRLSGEAHALLAMRTSHTVPIAVHQTSLTVLDRSLNSVRGGLTLSIDNSTGSSLRFVGAAAPDAQYFKNFSFPEIIPKGHCGMAMVHPRGWGGFSGCVCYEVVDATYPVSLMLTFENPLMGSAKFGVRLIENAFPSDLRRAFADMNGGSNQGIQGSAASTQGANGVSAEKGAAPATASIRSASRANATKAVHMPPSSVWVTSHKAVFGRRSVKAAVFTVSAQTICASVSEMQRIKMRSIELLGALEYAGPQTLKRLSAVSRRYRELVNNLPPPMFFGAGRRAYPDYTLLSDREASPWVVWGKDAVTWRIVFEGRILEREELSVVCDVDAQTTSRPILTISVESHARVASQFFYGDKRTPQLTLKESWVPFSSSMYLATPLGRTFGACNNDNQGQFTLSVGGTNPNKSDEPLYTARKKTGDSSGNNAARGHTSATSVVPSSSYVDPYLAGSYSAGALSGAGSNGNATGSGLTNRRGGTGADFSASPLAFMADKGNGSMMLQSQRAAAAATPSPSTTATAGRTALSGAGESTASLSSLNSGAGAKGAGRPANSLAHLARGDHYTLWRSQHVSGGAIPNTPARRTNQGAQIVAELRVAPQGLHALTRGYTIAEIRLLPGADALLATVMAFCVARW